MTQNRSFEKALALLVHPLSLAALALMLVNDQVLRRLSPSWWTGKLSDLAWLFLAPFIAAAVLAWLVPGKNRPNPHETWTFGLAYGLTGGLFFLWKSVPAVNVLATRIFYQITNTPPALALDPTDLLALPALALSAWLWQTTRGRARSLPALPDTARGLMILPIAMLILLADAAAPDYGITCFSRAGSQIYASGGYDSSFVSQDGGITWQASLPGEPNRCTQEAAAVPGEWQEAPGPQDNTRYRYRPDEEIQVSTDGGKSWKTGLKFTPFTEAERTYYLKSRQGSPMVNPGPLDAVADPATGNMLFAMGQQGVLVHTAQGQWQWSQGGPYQRTENFPSSDALFLLLGGMAFLALGAALLIYASLALRWTKHWFRIALLVLAWLAWLGVVALFPPAASYSYSETIAWMGILALAVLIVPLAAEQTVRVAKRAPRSLPGMLAFALAGGLLFFLPYVFWVYNALPGILWATIISLVLAVAALVAGWLQFLRNRAKVSG